MKKQRPHFRSLQVFRALGTQASVGVLINQHAAAHINLYNSIHAVLLIVPVVITLPFEFVRPQRLTPVRMAVIIFLKLFLCTKPCGGQVQWEALREALRNDIITVIWTAFFQEMFPEGKGRKDGEEG